MWEENKYCIWDNKSNEGVQTRKAFKVMSNMNVWEQWMRKVTKEWKYSCEHNLSGSGVGRRSWLGWAAVAYATSVPSDITRIAWGGLSRQQQENANMIATKIIKDWESNYAKNIHR